jgi:hypothetical protein
VARRCTLGQCWESRGGGGGGGGGSALDEVILEKSMNALRMLLRIDATSSRMPTIRTIVRRRRRESLTMARAPRLAFDRLSSPAVPRTPDA